MGAIATAVLALVTQVMPYISAGVAGASTISKIIGILQVLIPAITTGAQDLYPTVKNIIATLRGSSAITKEQLDTLDQIEAQADAAFDIALSAAQAADAAAAALAAPKAT